MVLKIMALSYYVGINCGLETLVSQAYGAGNMHMCGVYLWTGRLIVVISFIPIFILLWHTEYFLLKLG